MKSLPRAGAGLVMGWFREARRLVRAGGGGSVAGAVPPVVGYVAVANQLNQAALLLFLLLVFWQMPHFYAIALRRKKDYVAAGLPVLPAKKGDRAAVRQILFYEAAFMAVVVVFWLQGYASLLFLVIMLGLSWEWLRRSWSGYSAPDRVAWARRVFLFSLIVLLGLCASISIDSLT